MLGSCAAWFFPAAVKNKTFLRMIFSCSFWGVLDYQIGGTSSCCCLMLPSCAHALLRAIANVRTSTSVASKRLPPLRMFFWWRWAVSQGAIPRFPIVESLIATVPGTSVDVLSTSQARPRVALLARANVLVTRRKTLATGNTAEYVTSCGADGRTVRFIS